jgi:glycosyltransferase involved in cell wall biosynthesis
MRHLDSPAVRVLVFHGYLLRGTGSNIYNAELAETLVRLGHEVHLLCQDRSPAQLGFVDSVGEWEEDGRLVVRAVAHPAYAGRCTVYRPDIGGLLPVYVYDRYEGFEARTFDRLTDGELDHYLEANVAAVRAVAARAEPDVGFANHLVMGPVILARALEQVPYAVKIHGSALEYTVKPHYQRFAPYAREGLVPARAVLVGSRHTAESLWAAVPLEDLPERTRLGPPGVDTHTFAPRNRVEAHAEIEALARWLESKERTGFDARAAEALDHLCAPAREQPPDGEVLAAVRAEYDPAGVDVRAPEALASLDPASGPIVCFVGKLIVSKGVDLLLAAWPLVLAREPRARLVVVGFGTYREGLEVLLRGIERADERLLSQVFRYGRALEGGPRDQLTYLRSFFESLSGRHERYFAAARKLRESVVFTGRLEHGELARLLPAAEAVVVPSMFPEAFGMVAAEAAACGALPVCAAHSGLAEVASVLGERLPLEVRSLLTFERGMRAVEGIAHALDGWLDLGEETRALARARLAETARERFGWEKVAEGMLAGARGQLELLEPVGVSLPFAPPG